MEYAQFAENSYIYDMNTTFGSEIMGIMTKSYVDTIFDAKTPEEALACGRRGSQRALLASQ